MNDVLVEILEQVKLGKISEVDAEVQYLEVIKAQSNESSDVNDHAYRSIEMIKAGTDVEFRMFLFLPFGFGNETVSWSWSNAFKQMHNVEVWIISASDILDWQQLVSYFTESMASLCDLPFVVYGHSMGGIIAYEVLVELQKIYGLSPILFIPSSVAPPSVFEKLKLLSPFYNITQKMAMSDCRELLQYSQIILPLRSGVTPMSDEGLNCDINLIKTYEHKHSEKTLSCPITALQANNDILLQEGVTLSLWQKFTNGHFFYREVEGTHLYFMNPPQSFFVMIKEVLANYNSVADQHFEAKVYQLLSYKIGTQDVHVYPYGMQPKGYLIYMPDGNMAAHIWNISRSETESNDKLKISNSNAELLLSYLAYSGNYEHHNGVIEHSVEVSINPNFVNDTLTRYYDLSDEKMILTTAPLTKKKSRQSKSDEYSELVWIDAKLKEKYSQHPLIGSWELVSYQTEEKEVDNVVLKGQPNGVLLLTKEGFFSMILTSIEQTLPCYDNIILASADEIASAVMSSHSICGHFDIIDSQYIRCFLDVDLHTKSPALLDIRFLLSGQELELLLLSKQGSVQQRQVWRKK